MDTKFRLGDKVKTLVEYDQNNNHLFPLGTVGVITCVGSGYEYYPYKVDADNDYYFYDDDMLELVERGGGYHRVCKLLRQVEENAYERGRYDYSREHDKDINITTEEAAIEFLKDSGWLENHDDELINRSGYKRGYTDGYNDKKSEQLESVSGNTDFEFGDCKISDRGIEKVVKVVGDGAYVAQLVIPKEVFVEAMHRWS